jgi:E3 ubiquitin-protein ligase RNF14
MKSPCYLRLWELEGGDGGEGEVGLGFGGGPLGGDQKHDVLNPWDDDSDSDSTDGGPNDNGDWSDEEWEGQQRVRQPPPPAPNPPRAPARAAAPQNPFQGMQGNQGLGRGRGAPPPQQELPGRPRQQGLQRFIAMAQNDDEDDWDSDEAGSDFEI